MKKNSVVPAILAIASVIGLGLTTYFCAKEAPEAKEALDEAEAERAKEVKKEEDSSKEDSSEESNEDDDAEDPEPLTFFEKAKIVAPYCKKTIIAFGGTILTIAGGHIVHVSIVGSTLAMAYKWRNKYFDLDGVIKKKAKEFQEATGIDIHKELKKEASVKAAKKKTEEKKDPNVFEKLKKDVDKKLNKNGKFDFYEDYSGQIVTASREQIYVAKDYINKHMVNGTFAQFNKVLSILGGKPSDEYEDIGWDGSDEELLELLYFNGTGPYIDIDTYVYTDENGNGEPMICLLFSVPPRAMSKESMLSNI